MEIRRLLAILAFAFAAASPAGAKEPAPTPAAVFDWTGVWAVFDQGVDLVNLVVERAGTVATTRLAPRAPAAEAGRWEGTEDALFIRYESGRGETILRHSSGFRHVARLEDPETRERTTRIGAAFRLTSRTVPFVGAWLMEGNGAILLLRSDGTGSRVTEPRAAGLWRVADGRAGIRWQDGSEEIFDPSRPGIRRVMPIVNAPKTSSD